MTKPKRKQKLVDFELSPEQRDKIERLLHPRDTVYSARFNARDLMNWRAEADRMEVSFTEWMEQAANEKLAKGGK